MKPAWRHVRFWRSNWRHAYQTAPVARPFKCCRRKGVNLVLISLFLPMPDSCRLFQCLRCHKQVIICTQCDRGNRYCPDGCAEKSRADSLKRAAKKYQKSRPGKLNNALRQQRFRARQQKKVTHQGSIKIPRCAVLHTESIVLETHQHRVTSADVLYCHCCGCA